MLEKMGEFFDNRLDGYDEHQLSCIDGAREFYPFTAQCLPSDKNAKVLDLGCGTGLELEEYFKLNPSAHVTGIDIASGMLDALRKKLPNNDITLILGSYFEISFGENEYDAAVSVESLHHFTKEEKTNLYKKVYNSLKRGGYFVLTDYFSMSEAEEKAHRSEYKRLKSEQGITNNEHYHYDTPLTVKNETYALLCGGFQSVEILRSWGATHTIIARK